MYHLAFVAAKCGQFQVEGVGNVDTIVHIFRRPQRYFPDFVGVEVLLQEIGIREVVPGIGKDGVEDDLASDAMIPMPDIAAVGVSSYHNFRLICPDEADQRLAEFRSILKALIWIAEEYDFPYPQHPGRIHLLLLSNFDQFLRLHAGIRGAFIAVGAHNVYDLLPLPGPTSHGSGNAVFRIIWMGRNHHRMSWIRLAKFGDVVT